MIQENLNEIYSRFRLDLYRHIFSILGEREGSLTAADYFSVEAIYLLGKPTISEFAKMLAISQPNATYRVKSLIDKGYIVKERSDKKSAYRLCVTEKFKKYYHEDMDCGNVMLKTLVEMFDEEQLESVDEILNMFVVKMREQDKIKGEKNNVEDNN